ncbi:MAG: YqjF family protein [Longimicrobiales bacterium]
MLQSWHQLLFAHWRVSRNVLRPLIPAQLRLDEFDGSAWVGLTPFRIVGLRARFLPPLPGVSSFPELNLRTYVRFGDTPGIYFFTLEAASLPAVIAARALYHLPYRHAEMTVHRTNDWIAYRSRRRKGNAAFAARYRPHGEPFHAVAGTVEHFLTERYALYTVDDEGRVLRGDVHHAPWPLQLAEAEVETNTITAAHGIERPREAPLLHYSEKLDTLLWRLKRVG